MPVVGLLLALAAVVVAVVVKRRRPPAPVENPWSWEGIEIEFATDPALLEPPRLVVTGKYMARPSVFRQAARDWAFSRHATPMLVLFDVTRGVEIHRASLDRIHGEYDARVRGLSISYAMPPPDPRPPDDDETRRSGGPFTVDIGFYLEQRSDPWELRIHAELGPLRSDPLTRR